MVQSIIYVSVIVTLGHIWISLLYVYFIEEPYWFFQIWKNEYNVFIEEVLLFVKCGII